MTFKLEEVPYQRGYDIGMGVHMASGERALKGAKGEVTAPLSGTGAISNFYFRRVETTTILETQLGVGAEASAGIGLFEASAAVKFAKDCRIQDSSLAVLIHAEQEMAFQQMDEPVLSNGAAAAVEQGQDLSKYGEYFVIGIRSGGRFFGVVRIDTKNVQERTRVDLALSGTYGGLFNAEAELTVQEVLSQANATAEATIHSEGGRITTYPTKGEPVKLLEQMSQAMDQWATSIESRPVPYYVMLAPYSYAEGPPPPNDFEREQQRRVLQRSAKLRSQTEDMLNLIDYILDPDHTNEFEIIPPPAGPDLPALRAALDGDLAVIAESASFSIDNFKQACGPEQYMRAIKGVPDFKLTILPANMPKHTGGPIVIDDIPVQSLRGLDLTHIQFVLENQYKTEAAIRNSPMNPHGELWLWTQAKLDFFWSGVVFKCMRDGRVFDLISEPALNPSIEVRDQSPGGEFDLVHKGSEVILKFKKVSE